MSRIKASEHLYAEFGQRFGSLVKNRKEFAGKIGVSYEAVRSWCNGIYLPNTTQLLEIKRELGISLDWLLTGKECASPAVISASLPQSIANNPILLKVGRILLSNDERAILALEYGVEGIHSRVERQTNLMEEMLKTQKEIVSLLKSDSDQEAGTGS